MFFAWNIKIHILDLIALIGPIENRINSVYSSKQQKEQDKYFIKKLIKSNSRIIEFKKKKMQDERSQKNENH